MKWRARISEFLEMRMPEGLLGKLKMLPKLAEMGAFFPKMVSDGPCKEVIRREKFSLDEFPDPALLAAGWRPLHHAADGVLEESRTPASATAAATGCRCTTSAPPACTGRRTSRAPSIIGACCKEGKQKRMDVAVAIGSDPATMYSAILPLPPDLDEMMIAGFLRGKPVEMVKCETSDLEVPANSEIVLEGYVELGELRTRGTVRRSHRLLFARRRVSGVSRHVHHAAQASRFTRPPSWVRRRWRISTWAKRSSGFFCR